MKNGKSRERIYFLKASLALLMLLVAMGLLSASAGEISSGDIVFSANVSGRWDLWVLKSGQMDPRRLFDIPGDERYPASDAGGRHLAFIGGKRQVWVMETATGKKHQLPLPRGTYAHPAWSPDGGQLAFVQYRALPKDSGEIWYMMKSENGWQAPEKISAFPPTRSFPAWSPDGARIACATFTRDDQLGVVEEIGVIEVKGGGYTELTNDMADSFWPTWSPDGAAIAYTSNIEGNFDLWTTALSDGEKKQLTRNPAYDGEPSWGPEGREIVFVSSRTGHKELWAISIADKTERQLTNMKGVCAYPHWVGPGK